MINIIMIEDDEEFAQLLTNYLLKYNLKITNYSDPYMALVANIKNYDLLILDLSLPGIDGLEVCKKITKKSDIPIIISSARSDTSDKILGLQIGADDYLPKPYDPQEMYARIISLLRRYKKIQNKDKNILDYLSIDEKKQVILFKNEHLNLTAAEYVVLRLLIKNIGNNVSKEQIIYDSDVFVNSSENSINVIISRLRKKLNSNIQIKSTRGIGYRLV